ncbi:hypothetical protein Tco_1549302 [Tanacetum coccineum]
MSVMANTTPIVTTVMKTTTKEKTPKEMDVAPRVNVLDFYVEHYEDILPVIMDKIHHDKRKEVHTRLDFGENSKKSRRMREGSQNSSAGTLPARYRNPSERPKVRDRLRSNDENVFGWLETILEADTDPTASKNHMVIRAPPTRQGPYIDLTLVTATAPIARKEEGEMNPCYLQKKYVKDPVEIHNIKQRDGETIEIERFKVETRRMRGAPECMRISGFMHGVNNTKLTKRLNEQVPKTMKEMMTVTTAFIRGETAAASKKIGDAEHSTKAWMNFMIVRSLSPHNGIIGRPEIREIQAVPSTTHRMLKFPVDRGIVTIRSTILIPAKCTKVTTSSKEILKEAEVHHKNFKVALNLNFPDQEVAIEGMLSAKGRTKLCSILKKNLDTFAWKPSDMTGVPRSIAEDRLNIREGYLPVR